MAKIDFKNKIIEYLNQHPNEDISRDMLMNETGISKSRLSEIVTSIKLDGYNIISPPRSGIIRFEPSEKVEALSPIKDSDIRQWLILFLLSKYEHLSFRELLLKMMSLRDFSLEQMKILLDSESNTQQYDDTHLIKNIRKNTSKALANNRVEVAKEVISVTTLRKDLTELRNLGFVSMVQNEHTTYQLTSTAPYIIPISGDSLYEFCQKYEEAASTISDLEPLKQAYNHIRTIINLENSNSTMHRFGKVNDISEQQIDSFNAFISHPYKTNLLQFESTYNEITTTDEFAVGLLFYSVETGAYYALGKNHTKGLIESRRLDWIQKITTLKKKHREFHHKKYYEIFDEMFSSYYEKDSHHVKVLFSKYGNVARRFRDLQEVRPKSSIRPIQNPPVDFGYDYIYEDTIRGLSDFSRYLRSFGYSVLALEPQELQDKMLYTYNRIIERYGESDEKK